MTYGRCVTQIQNTEFCGWVFVINYSTKHNSKEIKTPRLILVRKRVSEKVNMIDVNRIFNYSLSNVEKSLLQSISCQYLIWIE